MSVKINSLDIEVLALHLLGQSEDDYDESELEENLMDEFNVDFAHLHLLVEKLLPMIDVGLSPLTGKRFVGFADKKAKAWIVSTPVESI